MGVRGDFRFGAVLSAFALGQGALGQIGQNGRIAKNCTEKLCLELGKKFVELPAPPPPRGFQSGAASLENRGFRAFGRFRRVLGP